MSLEEEQLHQSCGSQLIKIIQLFIVSGEMCRLNVFFFFVGGRRNGQFAAVGAAGGRPHRRLLVGAGRAAVPARRQSDAVPARDAAAPPAAAHRRRRDVGVAGLRPRRRRPIGARCQTRRLCAFLDFFLSPLRNLLRRHCSDFHS